MVYANFTSNDTINAFGNYIGTGVFNTLGSPDMVGAVVMLMVVLFCFLTHLPGDASVFLIVLAVMILSFGGLLPAAFFYVTLVLTALLLAWFLFKIFRL